MGLLIRDNKRGIALITVLLAVAVILIFIIAHISRVMTTYRLISQFYNSTAAIAIAEAGAEKGIWEANFNTAAQWNGWNQATDSDGNRTITTSINSFSADNNTNIGDIDISVSIPAAGNPLIINSTGYVPNRNNVKATRSVRVTLRQYSVFGQAAVALGNITFSGNATTDSYDSSLGAYNSQPHTQNGSITSNGSITLVGNAYINGDANPGMDYPFPSSPPPPVSGSYAPRQSPIVLDPIPTSAILSAKTNNNNANIINPSGATILNGCALSLSSTTVITLPAGVYYFTSVDVTGQAQILTSGKVEIYVDGGDMKMAGQGLINTGAPTDLMIYSTGQQIKFSGQSTFSGAIYAPSASVDLTGQTDYYGSIVCGGAALTDTGGTSIHYDMQLEDVAPSFGKYAVINWQKIN